MTSRPCAYSRPLRNLRRTERYHVKRPASMGGPVRRTGCQRQIDWVSRELYEGALWAEAPVSFLSISHHNLVPSFCFCLSHRRSKDKNKDVLRWFGKKPHVSVQCRFPDRYFFLASKGTLCLFSHKMCHNWVFTFSPQPQAHCLTSVEWDYQILFSCSVISSAWGEWRTYIQQSAPVWSHLHLWGRHKDSESLPVETREGFI